MSASPQTTINCLMRSAAATGGLVVCAVLRLPGQVDGALLLPGLFDRAPPRDVGAFQEEGVGITVHVELYARQGHGVRHIHAPQSQYEIAPCQTSVQFT